ncbi:hypothetical protein N3K66_002313 [Trichothecium roseum]|uniref:Uncharacterized protein n=1 Tax=Trichothecium roseum TaxID=47278 RepID=A0ACC0VAN2_9HYPO|nr:hypothetical protein N3K66_002313 [Trichothecium roseum]
MRSYLQQHDKAVGSHADSPPFSAELPRFSAQRHFTCQSPRWARLRSASDLGQLKYVDWADLYRLLAIDF